MTLPVVARLWRYPVKSMGGEPVDRLDLLPDRIIGDREFALVAAGTDRVVTGRRVPRLLQARARWRDGTVEITLPGARVLRPGDPGADAVLSAFAGRPVQLRRAPAHPAPSLVDDSPVHLLSDAALRTAARWYPGGQWHPRRFRANILLTTAADEPVEQAWVGSRLDVGSAVLSVTDPCPRCVMVTRGQGGLRTDNEILRTLIRRSGANLGVYAAVHTAGQVRVGDRLLVTNLAADPVSVRD